MEELLLGILELVIEPITWLFERWRDDGGGAVNPGAMESFDGED